VIRPSRLEDRERIIEICLASFYGVSIDHNIEEKFGLPKDSWQEKKRRSIEKELEKPELVFVAEEDGQVVGFITTQIDGDTGRIPNLGVDSAYRGRGLGKALIAHALDFFRQQGLKLARIETLDQNEVGKNLYPKMGFQQVALQIHYAMEL
jgi:ribosomal protein S18 acetylase RimI-like enzyme